MFERLIEADRARVAILPSTYSCRVAKVAGAEAFQMFLLESLTVHPVIDLPPESTG